MRAFALIGLLLGVSACINIGTKVKVSPNLLTLTPDAVRPAAPEQRPALDQTLSIAQPIVPQLLSYTRIPVIGATGRISYIVDATWIEPPASLFRALLREVISSKTKRVVIDSRELSITGGTKLTGQLLSFGIDEGAGQAVVTYDALLARGGSAQVAARRFTARVAASPISGRSAGSALNEAANQVAGQVADWVGSGT